MSTHDGTSRAHLCAEIELRVGLESFPLHRPFVIAGHTFRDLEVAVVELRRGDCVGRGEAAGVYYRNDTPAKVAAEIFRLADQGLPLTREPLQHCIGPGGARNALDCAFWELEARESRIPVWMLAGLTNPVPVLTTWTIGADEPAAMAARATAYGDARALKLKLTGTAHDSDRVRAVRQARPDVWLGVDANQSLTRRSFDRLYPVLLATDVRLIEQPFPIGMEPEHRELRSDIPLAADESIQGLADLRRFAQFFDVVNIKLDKCGGLTEALAMAREARALGKKVMVGNMLGTSLAMAPAYVVGQLCDIVDLDGPIFLAADRVHHVTYADGRIHCTPQVWGAA